MKIGILSDTHIGKTLKTNTTLASRNRLKDEIFSTASRSVDILESQVDCIIHTADLFDSASNDEFSIRDASNIANRCDVVMFGNHDVRNRKDSLSSIELLADLSHVLSPDETTYLRNRWSPGCDILPLSVTGSDHKVEGYFVTHCDSQKTFEKSLTSAKYAAKHEKEDGLDIAILFLHANYDNGLVTEKEQNLNLTSDSAEDLLEVFDFIIMGHEHQYAERFGGRVISVGTTHPTSFSDISDKFCLVLDTEQKKVTKIPTWSAADNYWSADVNGLIAGDRPSHKVQFIDITGEIESSKNVQVTDIVNELWDNCERLIACRTSKIEYLTEQGEKVESVEIESLPEAMMKETDGQMLELLKEAFDNVR